jgi:competence protein ComEC
METPNPQPPPSKFISLTAWMPLFWLSIAFIAGILLASLWSLPVFAWCILAGVAFFLSILLRILSAHHRISITPRLLYSLVLTAVFFLGAARYQSSLPRLDAYYVAWYNDREYEVQVTGTLSDPPDERDTYTNLRLDVTSVDTGNGRMPANGLMLARVPPNSDWHYGDMLRLRGHLRTPPENEDFSYQDYLAHQGIHAYMADAIATRLPFTGGNPLLRLVYAFKIQAIERVYRLFPDPEASLLAGILLGDDNGMPATLQQAYKNTGTAHIIAISGFNIAIIASLFVGLFSRLFGSRKGAIAAVIGIVAYTILVGATPSVVRAAIMGGLAIFARQVGRRQNGLNSLAATAAGMSVSNPHTLWDVSFQLSFAATLGLVLYATPFQDWLTGLLTRRFPPETARRISAPISTFMLFTLAAQLTTLPIMAWQFGRISLVSVVANPFVLPVQPAVMILAGLALLFSFIYLPLGQVLGWVAWPFAAYTNRAVEFFNGFPHGIIILGDFSFLFVALFYGILFSMTFAGPRLKLVLRPVLTTSVIVTGLSVSVFLVWSAAFRIPDGRLHLTFLDVGTADAILIQTPSRRSILVNGGPSPSVLANALGRRLPSFNRKIDWLVVASPQEKQVAALPRILERFPPGNVLWAGNFDASYSAGALDRWMAANGMPVTLAYPGAKLDLGEGAWLEVRSVSPRGAVLLVEWQNFRALLPIGMNLEPLAELENGREIGTVTVLLLADSGLAALNPPGWIAALRPQLVVLSVSAGDPDGLPDRNGWIDVSTNGLEMSVEVEKK